jgi:hypothetical protein
MENSSLAKIVLHGAQNSRMVVPVIERACA